MRTWPWMLALLVAVNLIPLAGVLWWGWRTAEILLLYWLESAIVGLYTLLRMLVVGRWGALPMVGFFLVHFGLFMVVHFVFLYSLFIGQETFQPLRDLADLVPRVRLAALGLLLSHGVSFVHYFVWLGEGRDWPLNRIMGRPYGRIVLMHLTLILAGWPTLLLGEPRAAVAFLVVLKILADSLSHVFTHRKRLQGPKPGPPESLGD